MQINDYVLLTLIAFSVYFDITQKKIPNFLTLPVILGGLAFYIFSGGFSGFLFSFWGFGLGLAVFLIPYMSGGMGGGDVKLMAAIGALKGAEFILMTTVFTAICGGVIALVYLISKRQLLQTLKKILSMVAVPFCNILALRFRTPIFRKIAVFFSPPCEQAQGNKSYIPYGIAIGLGTVIVLSGLGDQILPLAGFLSP